MRLVIEVDLPDEALDFETTSKLIRLVMDLYLDAEVQVHRRSSPMDIEIKTNDEKLVITAQSWVNYSVEYEGDVDAS